MSQRRKKIREWTERDDRMMRFLAQQRCVDLSAIVAAFEITERHAYRLMKEWRDDFKLINTQNIHPYGHGRESFTVMSLRPAKVTNYLGWEPLDRWKADHHTVVHAIQVSRVRVAVAGLDDNRWVSERQLRRDTVQSNRPVPHAIHDSAPAPQHVHDGRYRQGDRWWSVVVELENRNPIRLAETVRSAYKAMPAGDSLLFLYADDPIGDALDRAITQLIEAKTLPPQPRIRMLGMQDAINNRSIAIPRLAS